MIITRQQAHTITSRALDWLAANPDHHIRGQAARNKDGRDVSAYDPSATCFCAIGRIAKEAHLAGVSDRQPLATAKRVLEEIGVSDHYVWCMNDYGDLEVTENLTFVRAYVEKTAAIDPKDDVGSAARSRVYIAVAREQIACGQESRAYRYRSMRAKPAGQEV